jgi:hypothetical protein
MGIEEREELSTIGESDIIEYIKSSIEIII